MTSATETGRTGGPERLADRIAEAVTSCPDVESLAGGGVASYLPGHRVSGVAVRDTEVEVAVVVRYGKPMPEIADEVRAAVEPLVPGLPIDVRIDDIAPGAESAETSGTAGTAGNAETARAAAPGEAPGSPATTPPSSTGEGERDG
ncbi:Asp23/Gls24 family envelope stress response protein [Sphaerisporangium album]|uniref:Asp23/Gls24 family envelope stress response protein n=1 Tax=Sphaerisporangium album TaxID=509200 RepID=UPI0015F0819F|nr:Asp23/Gls24 family envelope stress response protein [Sphaerisporangium album]